MYIGRFTVKVFWRCTEEGRQCGTVGRGGISLFRSCPDCSLAVCNWEISQFLPLPPFLSPFFPPSPSPTSPSLFLSLPPPLKWEWGIPMFMESHCAYMERWLGTQVTSVISDLIPSSSSPSLCLDWEQKQTSLRSSTINENNTHPTYHDELEISAQRNSSSRSMTKYQGPLVTRLLKTSPI